MSKTKEETPKAPAPPSLAKSVLGYVIGAGLGLLALFALSSLLRNPPASQDELPHLAILVHAPKGFADAAARKALVKLHRDLIALGDLAVLGPLNYPVLLPGPTGLPTAHDLDTLTEAELAAAQPFFGVGGYLTRVLSPDLRYAVRSGVLMIGLQDEFKQEAMTLELYFVGDLVHRPPDFKGPKMGMGKNGVTLDEEGED